MKRSLLRTLLAVASTFVALTPGQSWAIPDRDPGDPPVPEPRLPPDQLPPAAPSIGLAARGSTTLSLQITDRSGFEDGMRLERRAPGESAYRTIVSWGVIPGSNATRTRDESGLTPDAPYRYRVAAFNEHGTVFSRELLVYTRDGNGNTVWRAELVLETANVSDADSDDPLHVSLNPNNTNIAPRNNSTWLDLPSDDFERGRTDSYDLNLNGVGELGDITHLYLSKSGDDAWCVRSLALKVNNTQVFERSFASLPGGCLWLDDDGNHSPRFAVSHPQLRAHPQWGAYNHTAALFLLAFQGIPNAELVSRFSGIVGDSIHDNELYWGHLYGAAVEVTRGCPASQATCQTLHVDLDLAAGVTGPNPEVDIDFDLNVACNDGDLTIETANVQISADSSLVWELVSLGLIELLDNKVESEVRAGFEAIERSISGVGSCRVFVDQAAGLRIEQDRGPAGRVRANTAVIAPAAAVRAR